MKQEIFEQDNLPLQEFENIGLASNGKLLLEPDDLMALLAGRRTGIIRIQNLSADGLVIKELDTKFSVIQNNSGDLELRFHPLYIKPVHSESFTPKEMGLLETGQIKNVIKNVKNADGVFREVILEFDVQNNEFVVTDSTKIIVPEIINNEVLNQEQQALFRRGLEIQTTDGSRFRFSALQATGIHSEYSAQIQQLDNYPHLQRSGPSR